ncbi:transcription elongation factor spt4 [Coniosporium apollinis]|uniref:Transcription elongation factor SPT4 n=1 Tax=Coniosporium apollinis TaxID=61459 RepID=A0ABQ9NVY3_9PEZI|nr:transcription elongation factor spt4 [Coniosporium apollinis]
MSQYPRNAMSNYAAPNQQRHLRACMVCSIVLLHSKFLQNGCPNCDSFLELAGSAENVAECTSQVYEGLIMMAQPQDSWVAKWQRIVNYVPGVYATKVVGQLPEYAIVGAENAGVKYIP